MKKLKEFKYVILTFLTVVFFGILALLKFNQNMDSELVELENEGNALENDLDGLNEELDGLEVEDLDDSGVVDYWTEEL